MRITGFFEKKVLRKFRAPAHSAAALSDASKPMIALTFDDGPGSSEVSDRILDLLSEYHAHATFFMIGSNALFYPDNVMRRSMLGHEIGCHTWDHRHMGDEVTREDMEMGIRAIEGITGKAPSCFRAPGGITTQLIRDVCREFGLPLYRWTIDARDWGLNDADKIYRAVVDSVKDGDIVLMHEIHERTARALEAILPALSARGFQFVTCRELIVAKTGKEPMPGTQYVSAFIPGNDAD